MLGLEMKAQGFLSSALRHVRDAEHLLRAEGPLRSVDQAYYLAGYGPECARKAAIPARAYDQAIGHGVGTSSELALEFALSTNGTAHRYELTDWQRRYPALAQWRETARYDVGGTYQPPQVAELVSQARQVVDLLAYALWADGLVPETFPW
jgi:hypothetical protein